MHTPALEAMLFLHDRHQCFVVGHQHAKVGTAQRKERDTAVPEIDDLSKQCPGTKRVRERQPFRSWREGRCIFC